ncbi:MAG TPA: hypothetical protein VN832_10035 [Stellaceae bacterium]|nr:hypothetical protein [Stellaceae bacterium]
MKPRAVMATVVCGLLLAVASLGTGKAQAQAWTKIDCAGSKITIVPMDRCWHGPNLTPYSAMQAEKLAHRPYGPVSCVFEQYSADAATATRLVYARAMIVNRSVGERGCFVGDDKSFPDSLKRLNAFIQQHGKNWSAVVEIAGVRGMRFDLPRRKCFAFLALGPSFRGGYIYHYHANLCGAVSGAPLTDADIAAFVVSVKMTPDLL